ncbi:MAG: hypothetical protein JJE09_02870 [Bacteroidia bacterium]|nr:hypothetical protein [Bacteroidia bacterium]
MFLLTSFVWIEDGFIEELTQKFENYNKRNQQVKVYLFFNQDKYAPGDTAFYKAHFLTDDLRPIAGKQILYLDIIDQEGKIVLRQSFSVRDGVGANQVILSRGITPGIYLFRAYSDWMKNFSPDYFYTKSIIITGQEQIIPIPPPANNLFTFHPEGGNLIEGISSKVVVRSLGRSEGQIIDNKNQVVSEFNLDEKGLGFFMIEPERGKSYYAKIVGQTQLHSLPVAILDGIALSVTQGVNGETLNLLVTAPIKSVLRSQELYLIVVAQSKLNYSVPFELEDKESLQIQLPHKKFPFGVSQISVINSKGKVLAERLIYIKDQSEIQVNISTEKYVYGSREKIAVNLSLKDELGNPIKSDLTVSVTNKKLFDNQGEMSTTKEEILFQDFLNPYDPFPFTAERSDKLWDSTIDNYMITRKWNRFRWLDVLSFTKAEMKYGFRNMLTIEGIALDKSTGNPVPDSTLINVFLQDQMMGYEVYTTKRGNFDLPFLFDFWGRDRLFYQMELKKREISTAELYVYKDTLVTQRALQFEVGENTDLYGDFKSKKRLIDDSFSFYTDVVQRDSSNLSNPNIEFEEEMFGVDISIDVEEYVIFPTMEELLREVIPSVRHRKVGGKSIVRVTLSDPNVIATGDPLYVIDGVMTKNTPYLLSLNPSKVLTVKLVKDINKLQRFGAMGRNGMLLIQTKKPDNDNLTKQSSIILVDGLSKSIEFRSPDYSIKSNTHMPDFRSTLYWNTSLKADVRGKASFSFYASDDIGPLQIKIEGITTDGRPFSKVSDVEVVFGRPKN